MALLAPLVYVTCENEEPEEGNVAARDETAQECIEKCRVTGREFERRTGRKEAL
jgi:hypothetical protein